MSQTILSTGACSYIKTLFSESVLMGGEGGGGGCILTESTKLTHLLTERQGRMINV